MSTRLLLATLLLFSAPAFARDYVVNVHGIVCSFCAFGVTKKVSRLPFIDNSRYTKGVKVEIEDQKLTIAVKKDHELNIEALFDAIESGGYEPIDVWSLTASGEPDIRVDQER